ncbi:FAD-dependent monooxygenase [Microtetraspora niveoalba]|uniref:FAD-dependent monooxygenase n=1 Tax=Microtetraspora niveoalba TaxID=46175 RepID=UPI00082D713F|nr:FAD-dependent monooxygenase [Microtetraspora niveoalba]
MSGLDVVVVGGGIGGLATAVALHRSGLRVAVLERAAEFTEVGAGLSLWPNAMRALAAIGLADRVVALGEVETAGGLRDRAGRWLSRVDNAEIARRYGHPLVVVRRADLVRTLVAALPPRALLPGREMRAVREDGEGVVVEHPGGSLRADLVVGADGLRSDLRRQRWPGSGAPRYSGCTAWRMITDPLAAAEPPNALRSGGGVFWGRGERIGFTALSGGRFYCFAAATAPEGGRATGEEIDEVRRRFGGWPDPIPMLLAAAPAGGVLRHDVYELPPPPSYARGRAALVGDAAHAMDPMLGQGACQALEDAVTLAACLGGGSGVEAALARYDRLRRPRARAVARRSARLAALSRWTSPGAVTVRDLAARLIPAAVTLRSMAPILDWRPPVERAEA